MPVAMEKALLATAAKRGYRKKRTGAYVYGTIYNKEHGKGRFAKNAPRNRAMKSRR